jgi:AcrR family transcriptional regulator
MSGVSSEQLRHAIVRAAMPLIDDYETLTMTQIAQAAGIDEVDLLAVFADKEAIIQACMVEMTLAIGTAINPVEEVQKIEAIHTDQPLASRLVEVIDILDAYYQRVRDDLNALQHAAGRGGDAPAPQSFGRQDIRGLSKLPEIQQAVAKLLEPDEQRLRLPAEVLAEAFLNMSLNGTRTVPSEQSPLPAGQVVDLFLHGALNTS